MAADDYTGTLDGALRWLGIRRPKDPNTPRRPSFEDRPTAMRRPEAVKPRKLPRG
jgi:hypothetical protein